MLFVDEAMPSAALRPKPPVPLYSSAGLKRLTEARDEHALRQQILAQRAMFGELAAEQLGMQAVRQHQAQMLAITNCSLGRSGFFYHDPVLRGGFNWLLIGGMVSSALTMVIAITGLVLAIL